jgi:hypothetical protein
MEFRMQITSARLKKYYVRPGAKSIGFFVEHRKNRSRRGGPSLASLEPTSRLPTFHNAACLRNHKLTPWFIFPQPGPSSTMYSFL